MTFSEKDIKVISDLSQDNDQQANLNDVNKDLADKFRGLFLSTRSGNKLKLTQDLISDIAVSKVNSTDIKDMHDTFNDIATITDEQDENDLFLVKFIQGNHSSVEYHKATWKDVLEIMKNNQE